LPSRRTWEREERETERRGDVRERERGALFDISMATKNAELFCSNVSCHHLLTL